MMKRTRENRRHLRLTHRAKVQLSSTQEIIIAYTKDLSDSGLYVLGRFNSQPLIGDIMEILLLDIEDAIPRQVIVRRIDAQVGFAVEFCE
jgi:hypothetical protein